MTTPMDADTRRAAALPSGTVTFVLGDMASSTRLWERHPDEMPAVLARLDELVEAALERRRGHRPAEQGEGDNFVAAFANATDAVLYVAELQAALTAEDWPGGLAVSVRMAVHTGDARLRDAERYMGEALNRCARMRALGHGGQVLLSAVTSALVVDHLTDGLFLRDLGAHQLRDLSQPERVAQLCGPGLPFDFPSLRSLDRTKMNLPVQLTSFVGRAGEVAEATLLLTQRRMVTLAGAGGCGKTRLAVQLGADVIDSFPDGVWFADLAPINDPALVAGTVAGAAGVAEVPGQPVLETLADRLAGSAALVVLDNCEHLLDAAAEAAEALLRQCPGVHVLATSREPLGADGETVYRVPSLGLPAGPDDAGCESVTLFAERAALARPSMRVGREEIAAMAAICARVDGIPLAIELAAARCRALTPTQIAERLTEHFGLLTGGSRRSLPRHRALEASVEWSYGLLTAEEQALLRALAAFAGGFTLEAAEAVGAEDPADSWAVVDRLTSLVDKSLVLQDDTARYRLLETVRQFAETRLVAAGEARAARDRHAEFFVGVAEAAESELYDTGTVTARRRLQPDLDNLRSAVDHAVAAGDADLALRLAVSLDLFWQAPLGEARERLARIQAVPGGDRRLRMMGYGAALEVECLAGAFDQMAAHSVAGLDLLDDSTDDGVRGWLLEQSGWVRFFLGQDGAEEAARAGLELLRTVDGARWRYYQLDAMCLIGLSVLAEGRTPAGSAFDEALAAAQAGTGAIGRARCGAIAGYFHVVGGDLVASRELLRSAAATLTECHDEVEAFATCGERLAAGLAGEAGAVGRVRDALVEARALGQGFGIALGSWSLAVLEAREPGTPGWADAVDEAEAWMSGAGFLCLGVWAQALRAQHLAADGDLAGARAAADAALAAVDSTARARLARGPVELARARVALAAGDPLAAEDAVHRALVALDEAGLPLQTVEALELVAGLAVDRSPAEAVRLFAAAAHARARLGYVPGGLEAGTLSAQLDRARAVLDPDIFDTTWGAGAEVSLADAVAYAARGRGPRRRPTRGWESLTPTELEVVGLIAAGLSNPQIAAKLFVSPETVKTHASSVFAKLGVANRTELATLAARRV